MSADIKGLRKTKIYVAVHPAMSGNGALGAFIVVCDSHAFVRLDVAKLRF